MFSKYSTTTVAVDLYFSGSSSSNPYQLAGYLVSTTFLAHRKRTSEILPSDRNTFLTQCMLSYRVNHLKVTS